MNLRRTLTRLPVAALAIGLLGFSAQPALADEDRCFHMGTMYSEGSASCQAGTQYRCEDGEWNSLGVACTSEKMARSKPCEFAGISFSTGSASCQTGTQYRCEDGAWKSLATPCSVGDAPVKVIREGRTCMFNDVTVATNSTICKSGATFLCNDGEWVNLGTLCR